MYFLSPVLSVWPSISSQTARLLTLQVAHHAVQRSLGFRRDIVRPELELALIFTQDDFVDKAAVGGFDVFGAGVDCGCRVVRLAGGLLRLAGGLLCLGGRLLGGACLAVDFGNFAFSLLDALLGLLERRTHRRDLVIHLADFRPNEFLRGACRRDRNGQGEHADDEYRFAHV